ncbi:MAG: restriction endonuclease [Calditrichaeota bacterium]|nr:MAG: restriction endonuclease [Calditrichota bacterium]
MNYWLHRISHHAEVSYPLLFDNNVLTIGFSDFANQGFLDSLLQVEESKRWSVFEQMIKEEEKWRNLPRTRYNLWRFIEGFKKGDKVVVPSQGAFSVFELVSETPQPISNLNTKDLKDWNGNSLKMQDGHISDGTDKIDLGFYWGVKPIAKKKISRKDFADSALTSRLKYRTTNTEISDIKDSVEKAISAFKENKPINLYSEILDKITKKVLESLTSKLNPDKFEKLVKFYFERNGATETLIPAKNAKGKEGDADVIAIFEPIRTIIYAQVKFHKTDSETNEWAVEQINDFRNNKETMDDDYTKIAWVVSSAKSFTEKSVKLAQDKNVHLIDGNRFAEMIIEAGIFDLNKVMQNN